MELQCSFYNKLYKKREAKESKYNFFNNSLNVLNNEQKIKCEGNLLEYECACSLKAMKDNKSPGFDGIYTTEFYKIFWNDIKVYLINSLNYSLQIGNLSDF